MQTLILSALGLGLLAAADEPPPNLIKTEMDDLHGTWMPISYTKVSAARTDTNPADFDKMRLVFRGDELIVQPVPPDPTKEKRAHFRLDLTKTPRRIDVTPDEKADSKSAGPRTLHGVYGVRGDTLKLAFGPGDEPPADLDPKPGALGEYMTFRREGR